MSDSPRTAENLPLPGGEFRLFITRLSFQGLLSCGVLENPVTGTKDVNAPGALMILEDLKMLQEKTRGNLDGDEEAHLTKVVSDLTHLYTKIADE